MSPIAIGLLAVSLSIDAFIAALARGAAAERRIGLSGVKAALGTGAVFGAAEAVTPLIGWALGVLASSRVEAFDHWIAFALLSGVGARMLLHAGRGGGVAPAAGRSLALLAAAVGTSVDAMAVGVSLAFLEVNIVAICLAIGAVTMAMSTTGALAGRLLGRRFGAALESFGGAALIGLGIWILLDHLSR